MDLCTKKMKIERKKNPEKPRKKTKKVKKQYTMGHPWSTYISTPWVTR